MALIKHGRLVADPWVELEDAQALPEAGDVIVSLGRWQRERDSLDVFAGRIGVRLQSSDLAESVADGLDRLSLVVVSFPKFNDGRAFSTARLLRQRYGFQGEIRASGHVIQDQFLFLDRCGVDAIEVADEGQAEAWTAALAEISVFYQPADQARRAVVQLRQGRGDSRCAL